MEPIERGPVVLFDDGSFLFHSLSGGVWKEVKRDGKMTGADARILLHTDPEAAKLLMKHRTDNGLNPILTNPGELPLDAGQDETGSNPPPAPGGQKKSKKSA